ncbi:hypothetical protein CC78DRAFT_549213 [Lojkania enalia]|uniref:Uncharacterized protein n=1 Tax=Lojkania enalia TaxID=147567 RepID=A0A9P4MUX7_9PLEO|nr:hypothetical protein CC78DRAFT_549213 [Didymosphaeria enalia]
MSVQCRPARPIGFLYLPGEAHNRIYFLVLGVDKPRFANPISLSAGEDTPPDSCVIFLQVCEQINSEAGSLLAQNAVLNVNLFYTSCFKPLDFGSSILLSEDERPEYLIASHGLAEFMNVHTYLNELGFVRQLPGAIYTFTANSAARLCEGSPERRHVTIHIDRYCWMDGSKAEQHLLKIMCSGAYTDWEIRISYYESYIWNPGDEGERDGIYRLNAECLNYGGKIDIVAELHGNPTHWEVDADMMIINIKLITPRHMNERSHRGHTVHGNFWLTMAMRFRQTRRKAGNQLKLLVGIVDEHKRNSEENLYVPVEVEERKRRASWMKVFEPECRKRVLEFVGEAHEELNRDLKGLH